MILLRIGLGAAAIYLVGLIVWASTQASVFEAFGPILADPWGLVAIVDLYLGFLLISVLVWCLEPDLRIRLGVIVPLYIIGNPWAVAWLIWRLPVILARLQRA